MISPTEVRLLWPSFWTTTIKAQNWHQFKWNLHTDWRHQNSGKVEQMNRNLKTVLTKYYRRDSGTVDRLATLSPPEDQDITRTCWKYVFWSPAWDIPTFNTDSLGRHASWEISPSKAAHAVRRDFSPGPIKHSRVSLPTDTLAQTHNLGDMVWVKDRKKVPLSLGWSDPYLIILTTSTVIKGAEIHTGFITPGSRKPIPMIIGRPTQMSWPP